jgi:hypothetical protein
MRHVISLAILFSLLGCESLPDKPDVHLCFINTDTMEAHCIPTDEDAGEFYLEIADMDKYVCTSPDDWAAIQLYIEKLKLKAQRKLKQLKELEERYKEDTYDEED